MAKRERPEECTDEMLNYLDDLRDSGRVNMLGAAVPLQEEFPHLSRREAQAVAVYWMETFGERHPDEAEAEEKE